MTSAIDLLQIVPTAPPVLSGVGDYAVALARELQTEWGIRSSFLVCDPDWKRQGPHREFDFDVLPVRRGPCLREALAARFAGRAPPVLLHLSPYGYQSSGAPAWLPAGLRRWKSLPDATLITYFHELYATGFPWQRAFWYSTLQRAVVRRVLEFTDHALTNTERYEAILAKWSPRHRARMRTLPISSNVGEPEIVNPSGARERQLTIWGSARAKSEALEKHRLVLEAAVDRLGLEHVVALGERSHELPPAIGRARLVQTGTADAATISDALSRSALGAFVYNPNFLGKSGLFAAFSAHGLPALCLANRPLEERCYDGLREGMHFVTSIDDRHGPRELECIAARARAWYLDHRLSHHAEAVARIVEARQG